MLQDEISVALSREIPALHKDDINPLKSRSGAIESTSHESRVTIVPHVCFDFDEPPPQDIQVQPITALNSL